MDPKNYELAVALRHALHRHPERSNHETWTKAYLIDFLDKHTSLEIVDRGAWFYAKYSAAPGAHKIAFRADFDALPIDETISLPYGSEIPGVSHKCGHDGHSATLAAFALEVDQRGAENTIYFIFQHAEETGDGAKECAVLVTEEGIEEVYGYHNQPGYPVGEVIVNDGSFQCASKEMSLFFEGEPAHASDPDVGRNPALAIARLICALPSLYRAQEYRARHRHQRDDEWADHNNLPHADLHRVCVPALQKQWCRVHRCGGMGRGAKIVNPNALTGNTGAEPGTDEISLPQRGRTIKQKQQTK